jgi:hypothetical protein
VGVSVRRKEVVVGLGVSVRVSPFVGPFVPLTVGLRTGPFVGLRTSVGGGVEVGGSRVAVGSIVTAKTIGSEGELPASTACISNWVFRSM